METNSLQIIQQKINDFLVRANTHLPDDNSLYFSGHFVTGKTDRPEILFIGINPGHGDWNNIEARKKYTKIQEYTEVPCKYIDEYQNNICFAKHVVEVILNGDVAKLSQCAETSFTSCFATPNVSVLNKQLALLSKELQKEHKELLDDVITLINPKCIMLIGWTVFNPYMAKYNKGVDVPTKTLKYGNGESDYYAKTEVNGITVYGMRHLSRSSNEMLDALQEHFIEELNH